ncbi:hypothetical protein LSCM1_03822 [Leishmania martiniquensis]|uniref:RING-type domain-containing protein n=1 Tax=Leishmania martiniquensis TaxID=1580590 RepID=A0A836H986_9TRYP|nr:hypothetical protein LSCM1_03822 [Leishmania martiniquensis]
MASFPAAPSLDLLPKSLSGVEEELQKTHTALLDDIKDELLCVVCGCIFIDPRVLECQHCFCLRCLYATVSRDRTSHIEVPCAYRCAAVTLTRGDIRTLPKNHFLANTCLLLRQHLVRQARLLERKLSLSAMADQEAPTSTEEPKGIAAAPPVTAEAATPLTAAATVSPTALCASSHTLVNKEIDALKELHECEWCSCASPTCEVCPYCWSRICAECRGQFSDHQYLCLELHEPGRRPAEGWLPGASTPTVADSDDGAAAGHERGALETEVTGGALEIGVAAQTPDQASPFPFFIIPFAVPVLVKECLVKKHRAILQLSEIDVRSLTAVRLAVPEVEVQCQHHTTGFGFDFRVHPSFKTAEGVEVDLTMPHWADGSGKPTTALSFLANTARLGEIVLQDLRRLSTVMSKVVLELSSAANQAYVRRNKGLHMYAVHVWLLVRSQCMIARDALLPHLERSRLLENIMGDLVVYQFQQMANHASAPQKHAIRDKCIAFMKVEVQLSRQLDQVMEGVAAVCRGIQTLLARMYTGMKELAQPKVHRGEEHRRSRQSRIRFSARLFQSRQQEHQDSRERKPQDSASAPVDRMTPLPRTGAGIIRSLSQRPPRTSALLVEAAAAFPPLPQNVTDAVPSLLSNNPRERDCSFRGQVAEHGAMTGVLTESMLSILRCFMQARVWEWSLSNTCIRECGLSESNRRALLAAEEELQVITDDLVHSIWSSSRMTYILEVEQDAAGRASSLDILVDAETLELLRGALESPMYDHSEVCESLKALSQLRAQFVASSAAITLAARHPDTQQELLSMMSSVLSTTMTHQTTVLRPVVQAATSLNENYAAYLRTRQMNPAVGERPSPNEDTLLAVDVLKLLQRQGGEKLVDYLAAVSKAGGRHDSAAREAHAPRGVAGAPVSAAAQGERMPGAPSAAARKGATPPLTCPFLTDFSLRDTALSSCQAYGEALVRVAHGAHLQSGSAPEGQQRGQSPEEQASAAAVGMEVGAEVPFPVAGALERFTESVERTFAARIEEMEPRILWPSTDTLRTADASVQRSASVVDTVTAEAVSLTASEESSSAHDDDTPHREPLFAADMNASVVALKHVSPSATDGDGIRKATKLFAASFQLPATTTVVGQRRLMLLPFYRGECVYKGRATLFYVDAQTGTVYMDPRTLSVASMHQRALVVLSSPLFFILLNATLRIFLHRPYRLEVMYQ